MQEAQKKTIKMEIKSNPEADKIIGERLIVNAITKEDKSIIEIPPAKLTPQNVIYWSEHYKRLEGAEGNTIQFKARKFVELDLVKYDKENKIYYVEPIPNSNSITYHLKFNKEIKKYNGKGFGEFECSCQFNQTHRMCSHILALYLQLKIWNWNKNDKGI